MIQHNSYFPKVQRHLTDKSLKAHQLFTVVVSLNDPIIGDANWHHQHVSDGAGAQSVNNDGQHASTSSGRLSTAGASAFQVNLQKLLLLHQFLYVLRETHRNYKRV